MRGLGAMLHDLGGGNGVDGSKYVGKKITGVKFEDDTITLSFGDLGKLQIRDEGQSCCEHRYMRTDDDIEELVGDNLVSMKVKDGPRTDGEYDIHEIQFLEIKTTGNIVTFSSHNEHNGYYGGIRLDLVELK